MGAGGRGLDKVLEVSPALSITTCLMALVAMACGDAARRPGSEPVRCAPGHTAPCRCDSGAVGSLGCTHGWTTPCDCSPAAPSRAVETGGGDRDAGTGGRGTSLGNAVDPCMAECLAMAVNFPSIPLDAVRRCCDRSCRGLPCVPRCSSGPYLVCEDDDPPVAPADECERLRQTLKRGLPPDGGPTGVGDACTGYGYVGLPDRTVRCSEGQCSFSCDSAAGARLCADLGMTCNFLVRYGDLCL